MPGIRLLVGAGNIAVGTFCAIPAPEAVEGAGAAGLDFVVVDDEHGCFDRESVRNAIMAGRGSGVDVLVRVPQGAPDDLLRALDGGAAGVIVSHVCGEHEARAVVEAGKYYPLGHRSMSQKTRASGYFVGNSQDYMQRANERVILGGIVETREGLANLDGILSVPGMDLVLVGHQDLAQSLGLPGGSEGIVSESVDAVVRRTARAGLMAAVNVPDAERARRFVELGARVLIISKDIGVLYSGYSAHLAAVRAAFPALRPARPGPA